MFLCNNPLQILNVLMEILFNFETNFFEKRKPFSKNWITVL